ncbi:MAG: glyoxalase superfamily protein [Cyanobacteria bacterium P01_F01_bin.116]
MNKELTNDTTTEIRKPETTARASQANLGSIRPVIGVKSYEEAVEYYIGWLGFTIEWEWRQAPGNPVVMQIVRDGVAIQLIEGQEPPPNTWIQILLDDIVSFAEELNLKRANSVTLDDNFPYVRQISTNDPFGNLLVFEQPVTPEEKHAIDERADKMRAYIRERLAAGHPCPKPEDVAEELFPSPTFSTKVHAADVLFEFPEYAQSNQT